MRNVKHSHGPWEVFICDDGSHWSGWPLCISVVGEFDKTVVRTGGFYPYKWDAATSQVEAVANARLIAAAPEMYEILCAVRDEHGYGLPIDTMFHINVALAKAEGRS